MSNRVIILVLKRFFYLLRLWFHRNSIMQKINSILNNGIPGGGREPVSSELSITPSKSKETTSTDDRHLPLLVENRVPSKNGEAAAIVLPFSDGEVHSHQQGNFTLRRRSIEPLCLPHQLRVQLGFQCQRVLYHVHRPKRRRWVQPWWNYFYGRRVPSTHHVVPIQPVYIIQI